MARQLTHDELIAEATRRADATFDAAVAKGKARYAAEEARQARKAQRNVVKCLHCGDHNVNPKYGAFCTQWCAAAFGMHMAQDHRCCRVCGEWRRDGEWPCAHGTSDEYVPSGRLAS